MMMVHLFLFKIFQYNLKHWLSVSALWWLAATFLSIPSCFFFFFFFGGGDSISNHGLSTNLQLVCPLRRMWGVVMVACPLVRSLVDYGTLLWIWSPGIVLLSTKIGECDILPLVFPRSAHLWTYLCFCGYCIFAFSDFHPDNISTPPRVVGTPGSHHMHILL